MDEESLDIKLTFSPHPSASSASLRVCHLPRWGRLMIYMRPPDIVPISRHSAQDDLFKWGVVVILRFLELPRAPTTIGLIKFLTSSLEQRHK